MTTSIANHEPGAVTPLGRRAVIRRGLAGGLALTAVLVEAAFHGVDAKPKPLLKFRKKVKTTGSSPSSNDTSNDSTGSNAPSGAPATGDSHTGASAGDDTTGTAQNGTSSQGGTTTGTSVHCITQGEIVDLNNPANNRPASRVCTTTP